MNHDSFMASLATLAGGNVLDITVASPASMVLGGSNVSLFNQHEGKPSLPRSLTCNTSGS